MSALFDVEPQAPARPELPALIGSERQVRWAQDIREKKLRECYTAIRERQQLAAIWEERGLAEKAEGMRETLRFVAGVLAKWEAEDRSWVWIDGRNMTAEQFLAHRG